LNVNGSAYIVGMFEHPARKIPDKSTAQIHFEVARGALDDANLDFSDVDGFFSASDALGLGSINLVDYLGIAPRHIDNSELGGASYVYLVEKAAQAISARLCDVALIVLAGRPRSERRPGTATYGLGATPDRSFELPYGPMIQGLYAMAARRHMHEFGTTSEQLAWVKVAASHHASHNPNAMLRDKVTVEDVLSSPLIADPLHRLDCCIVSDGGGALVVAHESVARSLGAKLIRVAGGGAAIKGQSGGKVDLTFSAGRHSGADAYARAGVSPADIKYAGVYDSFTITVLMQLEDLGFCEKGGGGRFVADGNLISGIGKLPVNTDGGGLCNNHPANRGGMTKVIEAVRQLRGEANPAVQVPNCDLALAHGTGGSLGTRHGAATVILERIG